MKPGIYRLVLVFIAVTIVATIALQLHWNIRNYRENRRLLLNEIQTAFDSGVENYFAEKTKKDVLIFTDSLREKFPDQFTQVDTPSTNALRNMNLKFKRIGDSSKRIIKIYHSADLLPEKLIDDGAKMKIPDKKTREVMNFTARIVTSIMTDSVDLNALDSGVTKELRRKNIGIDYQIEHFKHDVHKQRNPELITALANSTFLPPGQNIRLSYHDPTRLILQRSSTEIILSLMLSLSIIGCLFYLLRIINRQKKIDEIRNDLISNITHEFKTPITTISSAIEGIRSFNEANDKKKTERYLDISERQLGKLQSMVEKLLETATLDAGDLPLKKEPVNLAELLNSITEKHLIGDNMQRITTETADTVTIQADAFHLENAISNIVDNAVKYGGTRINVRLESGPTQVSIYIEDDGNGIEGDHRERIFEKFYRIPTGNVHDVKGFGIGLFYSRKIIAKHGGSLDLIPHKELTIFKIMLPYA